MCSLFSDQIYTPKIVLAATGNNAPIIVPTKGTKVIVTNTWYTTTLSSGRIPVTVSATGNPEVSTISLQVSPPCHHNDQHSTLSGSAFFFFEPPGTQGLQFVNTAGNPTWDPESKRLVFTFQFGNGGSQFPQIPTTFIATGSFQFQATYN